jgi:ketosteroid isomerase-like protein
LITKTKELIIQGNAKWKKSFNEGNASACADCYEDNAIMIAKPFGTFVGKEAIRGFWDKLIKDGFNSV